MKPLADTGIRRFRLHDGGHHSVNTEERKRLRELSEKATKGPWETWPSPNEYFFGAPNMNSVGVTIWESRHEPGPANDNAAFIAAAREAVPALLDALDEAEQELDGLYSDNWIETRKRLEAENAALRERLERVVKAVREYLDDEDRDGLDDINLRAALARADKTDKEGQ